MFKNYTNSQDILRASHLQRAEHPESHKWKWRERIDWWWWSFPDPKLLSCGLKIKRIVKFNKYLKSKNHCSSIWIGGNHQKADITGNLAWRQSLI